MTLEVTETGDYTTGALPETVTFASQQAIATVTIPTQNDTTAEDLGKLTVTLVDGADYRAGWPNSHTFTIYDNDGAKPSVSVTRDQAWVNEGQPVSFTVTRSTPTDSALQARLELNRVRLRVTQADLDDPTRGITTPLNHIHFDTEEITVDFPAGTRTVTVTRQTTDDSLNYGNSTYHATVLNDADDDYVALFNASAFIWVQDDDIATVTGSSTTSEFFDGFHVLVLPFSRTGDVSGRLFVDADITHVKHMPVPLQDETSTRAEVRGWRFDPGDSIGISIGSFGYARALGRSGTLELRPHYCPDSPAGLRLLSPVPGGDPTEHQLPVLQQIHGCAHQAGQGFRKRRRRRHIHPVPPRGQARLHYPPSPGERPSDPEGRIHLGRRSTDCYLCRQPGDDHPQRADNRRQLWTNSTAQLPRNCCTQV